MTAPAQRNAKHVTHEHEAEPAVRAGSAGPDPQRRPADSTERAYRTIRRLVVDFQLRPNERINEVQLARECALSRSPVREALNRLATEGFLSFVPNRGFFFRSPDIAELVQIFEARAVLEKGSFALACTRASAAGVQELEQFWSAALVEYGSSDADRILELDETFHLRLVALSGNQELVRQLTAINARIRFVRRIEIGRGPRHATMIGDHEDLVGAIRDRAVLRGQKVLAAHISMSIEDAADVLKEAVFKAYAAAAGANAA
jgi:DNA-binding GntR family transcriptional regulator